MNILHMKYAYEVAKAGSLSKASEALLVAVPNISRSIKELETGLGITIFDRTAKGMTLTLEGEEFMNYAKSILGQIDEVEKIYRDNTEKKKKFSISVPRANYISEAFVNFSNTLGKEPVEVFYKETNSQRTIHNLTERDYKLGIIRYAENYDKYFKEMMKEKDLVGEMVTKFSYSLLMSADNPLAKKDNITFNDLVGFIEIAYADPFVPSLPLSRVVKEELPDNINRRIFIFERASQVDLLSKNHETFMWVSPTSPEILERYNLVQKKCVDNTRVYKDVLIYKNGYKLTNLDRKFIESLNETKKKYL
ncbi:MAG: LysR family transcriptional regulator [Clostridia bacterium]|nr:LysR family transcriptional regulator [Clostridia bacterium]